MCLYNSGPYDGEHQYDYANIEANDLSSRRRMDQDQQLQSSNQERWIRCRVRQGVSRRRGGKEAVEEN